MFFAVQVQGFQSAKGITEASRVESGISEFK